MNTNQNSNSLFSHIVIGIWIFGVILIGMSLVFALIASLFDVELDREVTTILISGFSCSAIATSIAHASLLKNINWGLVSFTAMWIFAFSYVFSLILAKLENQYAGMVLIGSFVFGAIWLITGAVSFVQKLRNPPSED